MEEEQRVLLVDDEPDVLETVSSYLSDRGFRVLTASRWTEAIAQIQGAPPDIVLLDLYLPTVRGEALLEFIKEFDEDLPVVIISSGIDAEKIDQLSRLGAAGFVRKPFDAEDLLLVVEQALIERAAKAESDDVGVSWEPAVEADEEERDRSETAGPKGEAADVLPGSGVGTLETSRRMPVSRPRRRVKKRRVGRRKLKLRSYLVALVLCILIGALLWVLRDTFSSGFLGIGITQSTTEPELP